MCFCEVEMTTSKEGVGELKNKRENLKILFHAFEVS